MLISRSGIDAGGQSELNNTHPTVWRVLVEEIERDQVWGLNWEVISHNDNLPEKDSKATSNSEKGKEKEKEKENIGAGVSKKWSHTVIKLDGDDKEELVRPATQHGQPNGANNYSIANTNLLLDYVKAKLSLGPWR